MNIYKFIQSNFRNLFFVGASVFILFYLLSFFLPVTYKSTAILFPTDRSNQSVLSDSSVLGSVFGVSALDPEIQRHLSILNSGDFIYDFLISNQYLDEILERDINYDDKSLMENFQYKYSSINRFKKCFYSVFDQTTGELKFEFVWADRAKAAEILKNLISYLNSNTAQKVIRRSELNIEYLLSFASQTPNQVTSLGLTTATNKLLESESQKIMYATTVPDYAFQIIDSPDIKPERHSPNRFFIALCAAIILVSARLLYLLNKDGHITFGSNAK